MLTQAQQTELAHLKALVLALDEPTGTTTVTNGVETYYPDPKPHAPKLNPIQQKMAEGMSGLVAFLTQSTCGQACWEAREETCRCSCGGKNHGCMKTADGVRPTRTSKIDGYRYELKAVGYEGLDDQAQAICKTAHFGMVGSSDLVYHDVANWPKSPARIKTATIDQCNKWEELSAYKCEPNRPYLLWVRISENPV